MRARGVVLVRDVALGGQDRQDGGGRLVGYGGFRFVSVWVCYMCVFGGGVLICGRIPRPTIIHTDKRTPKH